MSRGKDKILWIAWQHHRRTEAICKKLDIPLIVRTSRYRGLARYIRLIWDTACDIRRNKPGILLLQNPSIVLCSFGLLLHPLFGFRLAIDAHNEGVMPYINTSLIFRWMTDLILRRADVTIVTNRYLAQHVRDKGGNPVILPDRVPELACNLKEPPVDVKADDRKSIVLICTHAADEPVQNIFHAAARFADRFSLFVTGKKDPEIISRYEYIPENVTFTGFLADDDYLSLLARCDCVIDLSLMPYCLVCGAYEAVALGKPLILTDDPAGRDLFTRGVVFTREDTGSIAKAFEEVLTKLDKLTEEIGSLKADMDEQWDKLSNILIAELNR